MNFSDDAFGPLVQGSYGRDKYDFTLFFEQTILTIAPTSILLLLTPIRVSQLWRRNVITRSTALDKIKPTAIAIWGVLQVAVLVLWCTSQSDRTRASVPEASLTVVAAVSLFILSYLEHQRSVRPSLLIVAFFLFSAICDIAQTRTLWLRGDIALAGLFSANLAMKLGLLLLESYEKRSFLTKPYSEYAAEELGGILNRSIFWWINRLLVQGYRSVLTPNDLQSIDQQLSSETLDDKMKHTWNAMQQSGHQFTLLRAIISCFKWPLVAVIPPRLCLIGFKFAQPLFINRAVLLIEAPSSPDNTHVGYGLIVAAALIYTGYAIAKAQYQHQLYRILTMTRGALVCLVYRHTLTVDAVSSKDSAAITLMSTDIDQINEGLLSTDALWAGVIEIAISVMLLQRQIGVACIVPVIAAFVSTLASFWIGKRGRSTVVQWVGAVERRVSGSTAVLESFKVVRMLGLTEILSSHLHDLRVAELKLARPFRTNIIATAGVSNIANLGAPAITLIVYAAILPSDGLTAARAFTSLSLISLLSRPVMDLVLSIQRCAAALGCIGRIEAYLKKMGDHANRRMTNDDSVITNEEDSILTMHDASFAYSPSSPPILSKININVKPATLTAIIGPVGCGKSTLLRAILREVPCTKGSILCNKQVNHVAYCDQSPWLRNCSFRDAILEASEFDQEWYDTVIHSCALRPDIAQLPLGDETMIGSQGAILSGGQKQRVAIARAIYARSKLILFDDAQASLDAETEQAVSNAILAKDGLRSKYGTTIMLATNSLKHLELADHLVVLSSEGRILEQGSHDQLSPKTRHGLSELRRSSNDDTAKESSIDRRPTTTNTSNSASPVQAGAPNKESELARQNGDVAIYLYFAKSMGWVNFALFIFVLLVFTQSNELQSLLLGWWTDSEASHPGKYTHMYMGLYAMLAALALAGIVGLLSVVLLIAGPRASVRLHGTLLKSVMHMHYSQYVATDTGTILNRFSQDMSLIDMELLVGLIDTWANAFMAITEVALIMAGASYTAIAIPLILITLYFLQKFYLRVSRQLRYLDLESKSPLYSHFTDTINGITTIRAFNWQSAFIKRIYGLLDTSQKPFYLLYCIQRWLSLVLDMLVAILAVLLVALATQFRSMSSGTALGIALFNILNFSSTLSALIRRWTELETSIGAVSRVKAFELSTPSEHTNMEVVCLPEGTTKGEIQFQKFSAAYSPGGQFVLQDITLSIKRGQRVGIIGRTGSGKSTLLLSLFSMTHITTGSIEISGLKSSTLKRESIRSGLVYIPQESILLPGSIRFNADPSSTLSDSSIQAALDKVGLLSHLLAKHQKTNSITSDDNVMNDLLSSKMDSTNLSHGQKGLFSVSRAILKKEILEREKDNDQILIIDELTSNVDAATEQHITDLISDVFRSWTILTVAHRLGTIEDYDVVVELDEGRIVKMSKPKDLLEGI